MALCFSSIIILIDKVEVVFDRNDRVEFEQKLLAEIAAAGPIPVQHLQIEEVLQIFSDT